MLRRFFSPDFWLVANANYSGKGKSSVTTIGFGGGDGREGGR